MEIWSELLNLINGAANRKISVEFRAHPASPHYEISGSADKWAVIHNSTPQLPCAAFAVGRIAELVFGAKFFPPDEAGLVLQPFKSVTVTEKWAATYPKRWVQNATKMEQLWMCFHHIGFIEKSFHSLTFKGLAVKYPQLAVKTPSGKITETTKISLKKAKEISPILYEMFKAQGHPAVFNLYDLDGTNFEETNFQPPQGLSAADLKYFQLSQSQGQPMGLLTNETSENYKANIRKWLPFDFTDRIILTDLYIQFYLEIERYFRAQGATCRFRIFAYSAYHYFPVGKKYDLRNFDVYYTTKEIQELTTESIARDQANWDAWAATGARMVWRPNLWFAYPLMPYTQANNHVRLIRKFWWGHEFIIDGYNFARFWFSQGFNYYTMARMQRGLTYTEASEEWFRGFGAFTRLETFYAAVKEISQRKIELPKNVRRVDFEAVPILYSKADITRLTGILGVEKASDPYLLKWFRAGVTISAAAYRLSVREITKESFLNLCGELNNKYEGLFVTANSIANNLSGRQDVSHS